VLKVIAEEQYEAEKRRKEAEFDYHFKSTVRSAAAMLI
jgi:hypothetical protein